MQKIRVLVANRPRLMRELVLATISEQPDIEVVGEIQDDGKIVEVTAQLCPDCLIIALEEPGVRPQLCDEVLGRWPNIRILALATRENNSVFYWATWTIRSTRVENSERGILNALRGQIETENALDLNVSQKIN